MTQNKHNIGYNFNARCEEKENEIYQEILNAKNGVTPEKFGVVELILIKRIAKLECKTGSDKRSNVINQYRPHISAVYGTCESCGCGSEKCDGSEVNYCYNCGSNLDWTLAKEFFPDLNQTQANAFLDSMEDASILLDNAEEVPMAFGEGNSKKG